ncbi:reactive intermediate/imine deaminase [Sporomusaceae bacterium FL31]|nr:reactive intermediate/imine deaminase [Sporomusaceae bacterium FL31]GCE32323.1 reactive intermediate/imine deaminase [Sporomusaceae bacterium]
MSENVSTRYCDHTYSPAIIAGEFIFVSHQSGRQDSLDITIQLATCFENLKLVLAEVGASLEDVVQINLILKNIADFAKARSVFPQYFHNGFSVCSAITEEFVSPSCLCQIDAVAYKEAK